MSGDKMRVAMLSLALVGLLLAATASAKNNIHVLGVDGSGGESEGRVVYADLKLAKTRSGGESDAPVPAPAPAPGPSSSDD
ncbi:hypothetical protein SEVIR_3G119500v4 [Setaria viridis]